MKTIPLTKGRVAFVDEADYERVRKLHWWCTQTYPGGTFYCLANVGSRRERKFLYLHRFILGVAPDQEVDHRDCNGLNNTRANLRLCSSGQNKGNMRLPSHNKSGFKGVSLTPDGYWRAQLQHKKERKHIGLFPTAQDAARAYDERALIAFGEFARTNKSMGLL